MSTCTIMIDEVIPNEIASRCERAARGLEEGESLEDVDLIKENGVSKISLHASEERRSLSYHVFV